MAGAQTRIRNVVMKPCAEAQASFQAQEQLRLDAEEIWSEAFPS